MTGGERPQNAGSALLATHADVAAVHMIAKAGEVCINLPRGFISGC